MAEANSVSRPISGTDKTLTFATGELAPQSQGAVTASIGICQQWFRAKYKLTYDGWEKNFATDMQGMPDSSSSFLAALPPTANPISCYPSASKHGL